MKPIKMVIKQSKDESGNVITRDNLPRVIAEGLLVNIAEVSGYNFIEDTVKNIKDYELEAVIKINESGNVDIEFITGTFEALVWALLSTNNLLKGGN